jgi:hypothetical protein
LNAQDSSEALPPNKEKPLKAAEKKDAKGLEAPGGLGRALKTVYDDTLREDVPQDFLDLLGKLH